MLLLQHQYQIHYHEEIPNEIKQIIVIYANDKYIAIDVFFAHIHL